MVHPLIEGFKRFRKYNYERGDLMPRLIEEGQSPDYFIISCIDSRSDPGTIFTPDPGTFFAHKAMGAIVRPYKKGTALAAALQFALEYNKVKEIIVLGHTSCGAINALISKTEDEEISSFIAVAKEGLDRAEKNCSAIECTHEELHRHTEEQIALLGARNLLTYPSVKKAVDEKRVVIRTWLFDMNNAEVVEYDPNENEFIELTDNDNTHPDKRVRNA